MNLKTENLKCATVKGKTPLHTYMSVFIISISDHPMMCDGDDPMRCVYHGQKDRGAVHFFNSKR